MWSVITQTPRGLICRSNLVASLLLKQLSLSSVWPHFQPPCDAQKPINVKEELWNIIQLLLSL